MDQILAEHLPFMIGGVVLGTILVLLPRQNKWGRRLSRTILALSVLYPVVILLLYLGQDHLGESYAYLILGGLFGILVGVMAGIALLAWLVVYFMGVRRRRAEEDVEHFD